MYIIILYVLVIYFRFFFKLNLERKIIKGIMYNIFNIVMELLDIYLIVSC